VNLAAGTNHSDRKKTRPPKNGGTSNIKYFFVLLQQYCFIVLLIKYWSRKQADFSTVAIMCIFYIWLVKWWQFQAELHA